MKPPRAVIAQVGHSGSGYIANVLRLAGANAGHESWFNPFDRYRPDLDVDSAWPSVPFLEGFKGIVWHQVREPLATITSLAFTADWKGPYFMVRKMGMREVTNNPVVDSMIAYVDLNLRAERYASRRWQVEEVDHKLVRSLLKELGIKPDSHKIRHALEQTKKNHNRHWQASPMPWHTLPDLPITEELREMGKRYGYDS